MIKLLLFVCGVLFLALSVLDTAAGRVSGADYRMISPPAAGNPAARLAELDGRARAAENAARKVYDNPAFDLAAGVVYEK